MTADPIAALEAALHTEAMNLPLEVLFGVLAEVKRLRAENEALKRPLTLDQIRAIPEAIGMRVSHDGVTIRSVGQSAGMTMDDGVLFARAIEAAHIKAAQAAKERTS